MVDSLPSAQRAQLAQEVRKRFVADAGQVVVVVAGAVQERLTALMSEAVPSREMQNRHDAWTFYQRHRVAWVEGTQHLWQAALNPPASTPKETLPGGLELVGNEAVENKIITSRLVLGVVEKAHPELNDLRIRIRHLEGPPELAEQDILRPEVLIHGMVQAWADAGLLRDAWLMVNDVILRQLAERLSEVYAQANAFLVAQGVMPTIELKDRVRRMAPAPGRLEASRQPPPAEQPAERGADAHGTLQNASAGTRSGTAFGGRAAWGQDAAGSKHSSVDGSTADETRLMTETTPLARARQRAQGVLGQLKRLLMGSDDASFEATQHHETTPALAAALAVRTSPDALYASPGMAMDDESPAGVARVAGALRQRTAELKNKAQTPSEKATIEIVALMFQSILQEDRLPPGIRVWFARLQMPVLRVALAEPDFFSTLSHPARQLIDRMGACVMGFDASGIHGSALETEIKRVVQVIEQYPETGRRVFQLVYDEFQKFLTKFLTGKASTQKMVGVAQQVEQKETLTIQYTIEMRNMLQDMPVRQEIREFLFKVWTEVLAMAAVRKGPQDSETLGLKKLASDLVWAASAKPSRSDRARVVQQLPELLQKLRSGMTLLGIAPSRQEAHIKTVSDTLADAFLSKTQAIPPEQIQAMAKRLVNLEDFVSDDGMADLPLDAQSIEMMLGMEDSHIVVVTDGGSKPSDAMQAWAQALQLGSWFTLDHNARVVQVQFMWRSERKHLNLFASTDGQSYLIQAGRLAAYLQAGLLLPQEEDTLTVRATRDALVKLQANPERLLS